MNSDDDFLGLEDLDVLDEFDQEEVSSTDKKKIKKKRGISLLKKVLLIFLITPIIGFLSFSFVSGYLNGQKNNEGDQNTNATPTEEVRVAELELVNLEQVSFLDKACFYMGEDQWRNTLHNLPSYTEDQTPQTIKTDLIDVLSRNAKRIETRAEMIEQIPSQVHQDSQQKVKGVMVTDNVKKVAGTPDEKNVMAAQSLALAHRDYASSLKSMVSDLRSIASYDPHGVRSAISRIQGSFEDINNQFLLDIQSSLNAEGFDNLTTIVEANESEYCAGTLVSENDVSDEQEKQISEQKIVSDYVVQQRCTKFIQSTNSIQNKSESLVNNINSCNAVISVSTIDSTNPLISEGVDTKDSERQQPVIEGAP